MSLPQEVTQEVFQVIEGGSTLGTAAEIIQFPTDAGGTVYNVVEKTYRGSNGTAFNYWVVAFETLVGTVATAVSSGAAILTMPLAGPTGAIVAIGAALGLTTGYVLYELSPEFWNDVSEDLVNAGETIHGKLITLLNEDGNMTYSQNAIEIIKNKLLEYGAFDNTYEEPDYSTTGNVDITTRVNPFTLLNHALSTNNRKIIIDDAYTRISDFINQYWGPKKVCFIRTFNDNTSWGGASPLTIYISKNNYDSISLGDNINCKIIQTYGFGNENQPIILQDWGQISSGGISSFTGHELEHNGKYSNINASETQGEGIQEGATIPTDAPFPSTFPQWIPWEFPIIDPEGTPQQLPDRFPVEYPDLLPEPEPYQDPAQNPNPNVEDNPDEVVRIIEDPNNDPSRETETDTPTEPDPDPQPEPDPIEDEPAPSTGDDPIDPNEDPTPSVPIVVPALPATVNSNKLFTVYNPSSSQLDALGGYLWDSSIIAAIRDIWQEPMDGLISLQQVFVTPTTSGSHNIILGFLDSGVSSPVVSDQFVTVDCGTVTIEENKENATDYAPYTSLHLYLPFIGIVELDTNECMNADISVTYKVDVYTGTCLAQVSVTREADMPNDPILYTFSGNCSQQLPLTSGNSTGVLSALLAGVSAGVSIASGGGLSTVAGYHLAGSSLTHEMMHVSHSGNISANAGIMGQKKPYIIIGRRHGYDANDYNTFYGFPANKTVFLANHTGYCKVKKCWIKTSATKAEYEEIMRILEEDGVFV